MTSRTLFVTSAFLLTMLNLIKSARGQGQVLASPLSKPAARAQAEDISYPQQQHFLRKVTQAVTHLEANGDRTMDAIENTQVTLTLDTIEDSSRLSVLCNNGGKTIGIFAQSLARSLQLHGKVSEAVCIGAGRDDDPFVMKFRLHYESGRTSLFYEQPPELLFTLEKPTEDDSNANPEIVESAERRPSLSESEIREDLDESHDIPAEPQPLTLTSKRSQTSHTVMRLPQGWTPVKLPDPVHAESPFGTIDSSFIFADGSLTVERKLVLKRDVVEVAELPVFQKWAEQADGVTTVALSSTLYYPYRNASAGTTEQKAAADLIDEAYREIESHEFAKAEAALSQAEAIDPGHEILHEDKGELADARGDHVTALAEYRKELEAYPNALFEMGSIAEAQRKLGDLDGEIATLQRWMAADPNSCLAATSLMEQYHKMGRDDLAVWVGGDAMNTMTPDAKRGVNFLLEYGREQMLTGQASGAKNTLESLLDLTVDDSIVNDAAYYLSEQGLSLDRAEQSVRDALTQFDPDDTESALSTSYTGDPSERTNLLLATWDTLGWILYREGAVREAEEYVSAAWRSRQDIAISRHLGEILKAEDKQVDAMDVYTLGLETIEGENAALMAKSPDAIAVRDALAQLKQKGFAPTVKDPKAALLALRTLDVGAAAKPRANTPCTANLSTSRLEIDIREHSTAEEPLVVSDHKLLAGYFPVSSKAALTVKGTIKCAKSCSLVFTP